MPAMLVQVAPKAESDKRLGYTYLFGNLSLEVEEGTWIAREERKKDTL